MAKIIVHLNVDESAILAETGQDNLTDAIIQELGWLQGSGMTVEGWNFEEGKNKN